MRTMGALVGLVSRIPARVQVKLLAAFLAIEVLLIVMGAVGLQVLSGVNQRTDELIKLQRKIEAYRQVQHDTTSQLYSISSALLVSVVATSPVGVSALGSVRTTRPSIGSASSSMLKPLPFSCGQAAPMRVQIAFLLRPRSFTA